MPCPGITRATSRLTEENAQRWEKTWNIEPGGLNRQRGLTTTEILGAVHPGGVRALYIMGENPMMSEPNLNHTRQHMEELEFVVAQDLFINESGAFADVFLPAAAWAEKDGTFTNTDRRVQRVRKAFPPRGEARADWQIICDIAKRIETRLGRSQSAYWDYTHPAEILAEMGRNVPEYAGVSYTAIEKSGLQTPVPTEGHPGTPFLFTQDFPRGRGKFHPLEYVPNVEMPDEEYPFILTTGRVLEHWHGGTMTRNSWLDDLFPEALMEINPADAAGLAFRMAARCGSPHGAARSCCAPGLQPKPTREWSSSHSISAKQPPTFSRSMLLIHRQRFRNTKPVWYESPAPSMKS